MDKKVFNIQLAKKEARFIASKNLASYIWGQSHIEGQTISYLSTETFLELIEKNKISLNKIFLNDEEYSTYTIDLLRALKRSWDAIFYYVELEEKNKLSLNEIISLNDLASSFEKNKMGSGVRNSPVEIQGSTYKPEAVLIPTKIEEELDIIWNNKNISELEKSIDLFLFISKTQIFYDGNKRTALLTASYNLINNGISGGIFVHPDKVREFKEKLIAYYEKSEKLPIANFIKKECLIYTEEFKKTEEYNKLFNY